MKKNMNITFCKRKIACCLAIFLFLFCLDCVFAGQNLKDDLYESAKNASDSKPEANSGSGNTDQIPVDSDDLAITGQGNQDQNQVSDADTAKALAYGYLVAGKDKAAIVKNLTGMGYSSLDSELAYSKAVNQLNGEQSNAAAASVTTQAEEAGEGAVVEEDAAAEPEKPALERLQDGIGKTKPVTKFISRIKGGEAFSKESGVVKDMVAEGYSADDIAGALSEMGYSTSEMAQIFKGAGVSGEEAYGAISKVALAETEKNFEATKPSAKFKSVNLGKWGQTLEEQNDQKLNELKQDTVKGIMGEMKSAGYDVTSILGGMVTDLKNAGMSAKEVLETVIADVAGAKPANKFKSGFSGIFRSSPQFSTYGEGEVELAAAMLSAGFSEAEVDAAFQNKNGKFYGAYSYTIGTRKAIISEAQNLLNLRTASPA